MKQKKQKKERNKTMPNEKLALKSELYRQRDEVTERLLKCQELKERQLLNERLNGINKLIDICKDRNRF